MGRVDTKIPFYLFRKKGDSLSERKFLQNFSKVCEKKFRTKTGFSQVSQIEIFVANLAFCDSQHNSEQN
jgi:hypothetical protein